MKRADATIRKESSASLSRWEALAVSPTPQLPFADHDGEPVVCLELRPGPRAIEDDSFPFEALSDIAEAESWRKEINRPTTHIHKWWAQRLGTVFRALILGAFAPSGAEVGTLTRREVDQVVVAYSFDLRTNKLATTQIANPNAGREHVFNSLPSRGRSGGCGDIARPQARAGGAGHGGRG